MNNVNLIVRIVAFGMVGLTCWAASAAMPDGSLPAALYTDPPLDPTHPASGQGIQFQSHGATLNGQLYRPPGEGVHPTIVLLHGLPGNEQNLDLAQSMRRAGWTVITLPALTQLHAEHESVRTFPSDHSFNDHRIALQAEVLRWLAALPGAPSLSPK